MLIDNMNYPKYGLTSEYRHIYSAISNFVEGGIVANGKYTIVEDKLIAIVSTYLTVSEQEGKWESHKKYVDIQYIIHGSEQIGITNVKDLEVNRPYKEEDDCIFYSGEGPYYFLQEGMFGVFDYSDAHKPGIMISAPSVVKKLIFKVRRDFMNFDPELVNEYVSSHVLR